MSESNYLEDGADYLPYYNEDYEDCDGYCDCCMNFYNCDKKYEADN